jgi:hypothetical protein
MKAKWADAMLNSAGQDMVPRYDMEVNAIKLVEDVEEYEQVFIEAAEFQRTSNAMSHGFGCACPICKVFAIGRELRDLLNAQRTRPLPPA